MSEKLILRLSSQSNHRVPWLVWSTSAQEIIASGELDNIDSLADIAHYGQHRTVTVLVSAADVRLIHHQLPTKPTRQVLSAIGFMLEDEFAEDIEQLHIALADSGFDKEKQQHFVNLAVVNKQLMQQWLSQLSQVGLVVKQMLPDVLCLPQSSNSDAWIELAGDWLVRQSQWQGMVLNQQWLELYSKELAELEPNKAICHYSPLTELPFTVSNELVLGEPELAMLMLAKNAESLKWNLLQNEFAVKKPVSKIWQVWRPTVILASVVAALHIGTVASSWIKAQQQLKQSQQQLAQAYKQAFPKEVVRINLLRTQLQRKVAQVNGGGTGETKGYLALLEKITPILNQYQKVTITGMRYDNQRSELRLAAQAPSFADFEQFRSALDLAEFELKQGAVNNDGELVSGTINIKWDD